MWAASAGQTETVAVLLKAGADANAQTQAGFTPLFFAIKSGKLAPVQLLLAAGADAGHRGPENTSALQLALYQKNWAAAALFVAHGDLAERDREGLQPLHRAAQSGDEALIAAMLAKGADANALTGPSRIVWRTEANFGIAPPPVPPKPPLLLAASNGHAGAMRLLVAAGAKPGFTAANGENALLAAAQGGDVAALRLALALTLNVNAVTVTGDTALHEVINYAQLHVLIVPGDTAQFAAMMQLLAEHKARIDLVDKYHMSAAKMADTGITEVKTVFRGYFPVTAAEIAAETTAARLAESDPPQKPAPDRAPHLEK